MSPAQAACCSTVAPPDWAGTPATGAHWRKPGEGPPGSCSAAAAAAQEWREEAGSCRHGLNLIRRGAEAHGCSAFLVTCCDAANHRYAGRTLSPTSRRLLVWLLGNVRCSAGYPSSGAPSEQPPEFAAHVERLTLISGMNHSGRQLLRPAEVEGSPRYRHSAKFGEVAAAGSSAISQNNPMCSVLTAQGSTGIYSSLRDPLHAYAAGNRGLVESKDLDSG